MVGLGSLGGRKRIDECQDARERLRVPLWSSEMSKGAGTYRFWEGKGLKDLDLRKGGVGGGVSWWRKEDPGISSFWSVGNGWKAVLSMREKGFRHPAIGGAAQQG